MFIDDGLGVSLFEKGQIWWCKDFVAADKKSEWAEGSLVGARPVILSTGIVIQNKIQAIPLSTCKQPYSDLQDSPGLYIKVQKGIISRVLIHLQKPVNITSLVKFHGQITVNAMEHIDRALSIYFGLADRAIAEEYRNKYFNIDVGIGIDDDRWSNTDSLDSYYDADPTVETFESKKKWCHQKQTSEKKHSGISPFIITVGVAANRKRTHESIGSKI